MIRDELMDILVCPQCKGKLEKSPPEALICRDCRLSYPIRDDIPIMLIDEAEKIDPERQNG